MPKCRVRCCCTCSYTSPFSMDTNTMSSFNPSVTKSIAPPPPPPCRAQQILADMKEKRKNLAVAITHSLNQKVHQDSQLWNTTCLKPPPSPSTSVLAQMGSTRANEILLDMKRKKMALSQTIRKTSSYITPLSPSSQSSYTIRRSEHTSPTASTAATSMSWLTSSNYPESFSNSDSSLNETNVKQETALEFFMDDSDTLSLKLGNPQTHSVPETSNKISFQIFPKELIAVRRVPTTWETSGREGTSLTNGIALIKSTSAITKQSLHKTGTKGAIATESTPIFVSHSDTSIGDASSIRIDDRKKNKLLLRGMLQTVADIRNKDITLSTASKVSMKRQTPSQSPSLPRFLETTMFSSSFNKLKNDFDDEISTPTLASRCNQTCEREQSITTLRSSDAVSANSQSNRCANVACHYILPVTTKPSRRKVYAKTKCDIYGTNQIMPSQPQVIPIELRKRSLRATNVVPSPLPRNDETSMKPKVLRNALSQPHVEEVVHEKTTNPSRQYPHLESKRSSDESRKRRSSSNKQKSKPSRELPEHLVFITIHKPSTRDYTSSGASITSDVSSLSCQHHGPSKEAKQLEKRLDAIIAARKAIITKGISKSTKIENIADRWCGGMYHIAVRSGMNGVGEQEI